jgi:hypothetical protein
VGAPPPAVPFPDDDWSDVAVTEPVKATPVPTHPTPVVDLEEVGFLPPPPAPVARAAPPPVAAPADGGEAALRLALSQASREVIERIAWEVVPQLAEVILREHVERLVKERQKG